MLHQIKAPKFYTDFGHQNPGPFPAILGKGPWLELGKNMRHFRLFRDFFLEV